MLTLREVRPGSREAGQVDALYRRVFPANERWPLETLLDDVGRGAEVLAIIEGEEFAGLAILMNSPIGISHIFYLAIAEDCRDRGLGTQALEAIHRRKAGLRVIVDIERETPGAPNNDQRRRRKAFYLRSGYRETPVKYRWRGESYEIMVHGGTLTKADFTRFWDSLDV